MTDSAIDKIRKLLAKAERTESEGERDTAMQMAQKLATKHQIDMARLVDAGIENDELVVSFVDIGSSGQHGKDALVSLYLGIGRANGLALGIAEDKTFVRAIGYQSDVHMSELLFKSLVGQMRHAAQKYLAIRDRTEVFYSEKHDDIRPVSTQMARRSFQEEFAKRVGVRLWNARESAVDDDNQERTEGEGAELVLADKSTRVSAFQDSWLEGEVERPYRPKRKGSSSQQARIAGRRAGEDARLAPTEQIG